MIKVLLMNMMMLFLASSCESQTPATSDFLEGKVFTIDNYINGKLDNNEDIIFAERKMEGTICVQYGFPKSEYRIVKKTKSQLNLNVP